MSLIRLTLPVALVLLTLALPPGASLPPAGCEGPFVHVPGQGLSCPTKGGWLVRLADGALVLTHGPDMVPQRPTVTPVPASASSIACVPDTQPHIRVIYAYPKFGNNFIAQKRGTITASVLHSSAIVDANARQHGVSLKWKVVCGADGLPSIDVVQLPTTALAADFSTITSDLINMGYFRELEKPLVFYDGNAPCGGCGGQSWIPGGDEASPSNWNNYGYYSHSLVYTGNYGTTSQWIIDEVVLHEETHGMGGVQLSAPHTSGGYHCNDGWDIMCYADGGSSSNYRTSCFPAGFTFAGAAMPYDCGKDDYFHPSPPAGSYLATHWNVGASYNRFLARG